MAQSINFASQVGRHGNGASFSLPAIVVVFLQYVTDMHNS